MRTEIDSIARFFGGRGGHRSIVAWLIMALLLAVAGCGEPSERELKNRRELEALLTAISLKNAKELDKDSKRIDDRHSSGELSRSARRRSGRNTPTRLRASTTLPWC